MNRSISATSNIAAAALTLSLLAGPASAAPLCARPQDMTALQAAALRQELMVAALTCRAADDFNLFVTTYRDELLTSDRALKAFFLRQGASTGEAAYDTYKTRLANEASQRSLHDPRFCRNAKMVFDVALKRSGALAALKSEPPRLIATGYTVCSPGKEKTVLAANAAPRSTARRVASLENVPSVPLPKAAPRSLRAAPPVSLQRVAMVEAKAAPIPAPTHRILSEGLPSASVAEMAAPRDRIVTQAPPPRDTREIDADDRQAVVQNADNSEPDDFDSDATDVYDDTGDEAPRYAPRYAEAQQPRSYDSRGDDSRDYRSYDVSYNNVPEAYRPGAYWVHEDEPPAPPRLVRGRDGHWYLMLYSGR